MLLKTRKWIRIKRISSACQGVQDATLNSMAGVHLIEKVTCEERLERGEVARKREEPGQRPKTGVCLACLQNRRSQCVEWDTEGKEL